MESEKSDFNPRLLCLLLKIHQYPLRGPRLYFPEDFRRNLEHNWGSAGDSFGSRSVFLSKWTFPQEKAVAS